MNKPNVIEAFNTVEVATRPENIYKLNRADFGNLGVCFEVLMEFIKEHAPKEEVPVVEKPKRGRPPNGAHGAPVKP